MTIGNMITKTPRKLDASDRAHKVQPRRWDSKRLKRALGKVSGRKYGAPVSALVVGESVDEDSDVICDLFDMRAGDYLACKCGTTVCSKRGPCAPKSEPIIECVTLYAPQQSSELLIAVGDRWAPSERRSNDIFVIVERINLGWVSYRWYDGMQHERSVAGFLASFRLVSRAKPAAEWVPPATWKRGTLGFMHDDNGNKVVFPSDQRGEWRALRNGLSFCRPTLAQACAAALGIELERVMAGGGVCEWIATRSGPDGHRQLVVHGDFGLDIEACARLAVERAS